MKSTLLEKSKFIDKQGIELADFAMSMIDKLVDADAVINLLLQRLGSTLNVDSIFIQEFVENSEAVKCTYEWNKNGTSVLINIEKRFLSLSFEDVKRVYASLPDGYYLFDGRKDEFKAQSIQRPEEVKSLVEIPLYRSDNLIGCIDVACYEDFYDWKPEKILMTKSLCKLLATYLLGLRNSVADKESIKDVLRQDSVTSLPYYEEFVFVCEEGAKVDTGMKLAICCADFSNFKYLNEKFGYETGNEILKLFSKSIYSFFDKTVSCCREYSDNFVFAFKVPEATEEEELVKRLEEFSNYFVFVAHKSFPEVHILLNIGISIALRGTPDIESTVAAANVARKQARELITDKPGRVTFFSKELLEKKKNEIKLISELDSALEKKEFKVYFQPKIECCTKRIAGAEALIRWIKDDGTMVYPDEFIPAFEHDGCIVKLDYFVYEYVFRYLRSRLDAGLRCYRISMNVSRVHLFSRAFVSYIDYLLNRFKVPAEYIEFEITESVYADELPSLRYTVEHLKSKGISLSIDDFGSGYSSFEIITQIPVDYIKLDRVFMKDTLNDEDKIIIGTVIEMCKRLGIGILCEGVETEEQLAFLEEEGCNEVQGYLFSRPIPVEVFNKMLENGYVV